MVYSLASEAVDEGDLRQLLEEIYQERSLSFFCSGQNIPMGDRDIWVVYRGVVQLNILYLSGEEGLLGLAADYMPFGLPLTAINAYYATTLSDNVI